MQNVSYSLLLSYHNFFFFKHTNATNCKFKSVCLNDMDFKTFCYYMPEGYTCSREDVCIVKE